MNQEMPQSEKDFKERPPQPLQKDERAICPHCWFEFLPKDAFFIAGHPDLSAGGDPVLGKTEKLRIPPAEVKATSKGRFEDSKGWDVVDRACPRCHLQIPVELLEKRPIFLSVTGPTAGGKTYFLTVLLHVLRHQLAANFNRSLDYSDSDELKAFTDLEDKLFNQGADKWTYIDRTFKEGAVFNRVKLDGHDVTLPKPFLFSMNPTSTSGEEGSKKEDLFQAFALYDNAGELFDLGVDRDPTFRAIEHLGVSDAIMFVFDPLQDEKTQSKLIENGCKDPGFLELKGKIVPQDKMLRSVIINAKRLGNLTKSGKIKPPLLVCVQKFDVWRKLLPAWAKIDSSSIEFIKAVDTSGLDIAELNSNSLLIRAFIYDISPSFVTMAEADFTSVRFFSVSAFGCSPELSGSEGKVGIRSGNLQPFRVTDPILWFMQKLGLIQAASKKNQCLNAAEVVSKDSEGFVVKFSGNRIKLDWEYAGLLVQDPWNGKDVIIPTKSQITGA